MSLYKFRRICCLLVNVAFIFLIFKYVFKNKIDILNYNWKYAKANESTIKYIFGKYLSMLSAKHRRIRHIILLISRILFRRWTSKRYAEAYSANSGC